MGFFSSFLEASLFTSVLSARRRDGYQLFQVVPLTPANLPWDFSGWAEDFLLDFSHGLALVVACAWARASTGRVQEGISWQVPQRYLQHGDEQERWGDAGRDEFAQGLPRMQRG